MAALNRHTLATQYPLSNITVKWESIGFPTNAQVGLTFRAIARRPVPCLHDRPFDTGIVSQATVRDMFAREDLGVFSGTYTAQVKLSLSRELCFLHRVT